MSYCGNCGTQLMKNDQFCAECGQQVQGEKAVNLEKRETATEQTRLGKGQGEPLFKSRKSKIIAICAAIFLILLAGSYFTVKQMTSSKAVAEGFIEAINKKDAKKIKKFINNGQYEMKADDRKAKEFLTYLHNNPRMITSIIEGLRYEAAVYENNASYGEPSPYVSLQHKGDKWVVFDNYTIKIPTYYMEISSDIDKTDIYVNGEKAGIIKEKEKSFGPFLPGEYEIKAVINSDYGTVEQKGKINTADLSGQTETIGFDWSDHFINIETNDETAYLFINNKNTGKKISEISELGPIPLNGSIKVFAQRKTGGGVENTEAVTVQKETGAANLYFEEAGFDYPSNMTAWSDGSDVAAIENVILGHYQKISDDEYRAAYDLFSSSRKSKVDLDVWKKGLQENIRDEVTKLENIEVTGNYAKADIRMTSYDRTADGKTLVQEWGGHWKLVWESDGWKLNEAKLDKLASRTE
ncbi:hypothetical protein ABET51_16425 [Metabacillus fastidiosus]|uniref:zinc ribbon domain-containing protein n=1 Tax=Metabacillus fastidiosus TaxID=1458 RepID=UPI002E239D08|nr:hypothetical protein [Metabacillus fastidiosus]